MLNPEVSVVIPTYNRPQKLLRAVDSVINQSYQDLEIIVVDDYPGEDNQDLLPTYGPLRYIQHNKNRGAPIARNNGILAAQGKYIALLDDDDEWKPQKLECQIERFNKLSDNFGLVYSGRDIVRRGEIIKTYIPKHEGKVYSTLLQKNIIPSETPLIRRECFGVIGLFDPRFKSSQDWDLWLRIASEYKVATVTKSLAISHESHKRRISTDMNRKYQGHKQLLEKHKSAFESHPAALAQLERQLGIFATQSGRNLEGFNYLLSAYSYDPSDWPILLYLIMSVTPNPVREWLFNIRSEAIRRLFE